MSLFEPDKYFSSIAAIDIRWDLKRQGITNVLLDIDNTIRRRDNDEIPPSVRSWLLRAREEGVALCLLSNNFHQNAFDVARELDLPIVAKAMKPLPFGFWRALKTLDAKAPQSVIVGDQLFTDVVGGHLVGMKAYLVRPLVDVDLKHTVLVRKVESRFIGDALPEGAMPEGAALETCARVDADKG